MNGFELIIFDCDGVLVDSERIANEVFARVLNDQFGFSLSLEDMYGKFVGHSSTQCMKIVEDMLGYPPPEELEERYKSEINSALAKEVVAVKGIKKTLEEITIPYCVASSGSHEKMHTTLSKANLIGHFKNKRFSTSEVLNSKPSPDIFLHAAKTMDKTPANKCLVIEDSPLGVRGGIAAGMTVFGFTELMKKHRLKQAGAHHLFDDMGNLASEILNFERTAI